MTPVPLKFTLTPSARATQRVWWKGAALFGVAVSVVACSSATPAAAPSAAGAAGAASSAAGAPAAPSSASGAPAASSSAAVTTSAAVTGSASAAQSDVAPAGGDVAAACNAVLTLNAAQPPGSDPDGPAPTAQQLTAWAAQVQPALTIAAAGAPQELSASFATLQKTADAAKRGTPLDTSDPVLNGALTTINASLHDNCGFQTLDVTNSAGALVGVPATLDAGPLAVEFTNSTDPAKASFVLLVARIKDGQTVPLADVLSGKADLSKVSDILTAAQPTGPDPAYAAATLTPGHDVVASPLGTPPAFSGTIGAEFDVK